MNKTFGFSLHMIIALRIFSSYIKRTGIWFSTKKLAILIFSSSWNGMVKNISHYSTVPFKRDKCILKLVAGLLSPELAFSSTKYLLLFILKLSVADPDPGSGAFLSPYSRIRDGKKSRTRFQDPE